MLFGVTTNPTLAKRFGMSDDIDMIKRIREVMPIGEIHVEAFGNDVSEIINNAERIQTYSSDNNLVFKIPFSPEGVEAVSILKSKNFKTNLHLIFSVNQALLSSGVNSDYICPLVGRLDDVGHDAFENLEKIINSFQNFDNINTKIMVSSVRHPQHVERAFLAGADVATIPSSVLEKMFNHPLTTLGYEEFENDIKAMQEYSNKEYISTSKESPPIAVLGTIESDASVHYGFFNKEEMFGKRALDELLLFPGWNTALDVGAGKCIQSEYLKSKGKQVYTCDMNISGGANCKTDEFSYDYVGNFLDINFDKSFDCTYAIHVLEHQKNVGLFVDKLKLITKPSGLICFVIPIRKPFIVSGHLSIWNAGLLLYNLVSSGIDCRDCKILQYDYNICLIVKNNSFDVSELNLHHDVGDLKKLSEFFPKELREKCNRDDWFDGDIFNLNW